MSDEAVQDQNKETQTDSSPPRGKKNFLMIFVPGLLLQAVLAYFLVTKLVAPPPSQTAEPENKPEQVATNDHSDIYVIEDIIVNPAGSEGRRFVNVTVGLEYTDSAVGKELEAHSVQLRDLLINLFASRTVQELDDVTEKEVLKREILERVNQSLPRGRIVRVYYVNFIMQ